jgi:hypothetical protein
MVINIEPWNPSTEFNELHATVGYIEPHPKRERNEESRNRSRQGSILASGAFRSPPVVNTTRPAKIGIQIARDSNG